MLAHDMYYKYDTILKNVGLSWRVLMGALTSDLTKKPMKSKLEY